MIDENLSPDQDCLFMRRCLQLAANGKGRVSPNPMVGAVIVKDGVVIGESWHQKAGMPHAEPLAIKSVSDVSLLKESTLYVNLEPCSHYGKTPPCVDLIIQHHIPRVVIGTLDIFPLVAGRGIKKLKEAGVDVIVGVEAGACRELNKAFFTYHTLKRPYITLKWANTLDGFLDFKRTGTETDNQLMISSSFTRLYTHKQRAENDVILVGTNTARLDNPALSVRDWSGKHPVRAVIDKDLKLDSGLSLFDGTVETIVFTEKSCPNKKGITYVTLDFTTDILPQLLDVFYKLKLLNLLVEGGTVLHESFLKAGLWDEIQIETAAINIQDGVKAPDINQICKQNISYRLINETDGSRSIQTFRTCGNPDYIRPF